MRVIAKRRLMELAAQHGDCIDQVADWYRVARRSDWRNLAEVRESFRHADTVGDKTVFNIKGNKYRLISEINYRYQRLYIRHVLTHAEYDQEKWTR